MGDIPHQFHYLHGSSAVKGVLTFLASTDSDGLIVVAHDHSLLHNLFVKSTSQSLAHHLSVPMLVLHDAEKK